jgi:hypothetical protein
VVTINGKRVETLVPGRYAFWKGVGNLHVAIIDRREVSLDIAGAPAGESLTLSCRMPAAALPFSSADRRVVTTGGLQLVVHLSEPRES